MRSRATTVAAYLAELPPERRAVLAAVRAVILANLDRDYEEGMQYGMIGYYVPHRVFPAGYHCDPRQPLPFAALAAQKGYFSLYLMSAYGAGQEEARLRAEFARAGKTLDMGKSCIRFRRLEDLPLDVVGAAVRCVPAEVYVAHYQRALQALRSRPARTATGRSAARGGAKRAAASRPARQRRRPRARKGR